MLVLVVGFLRERLKLLDACDPSSLLITQDANTRSDGLVKFQRGGVIKFRADSASVCLIRLRPGCSVGCISPSGPTPV